MPKKKSKSEVNYRDATGAQHCGNCSMFTRMQRDMGECSLVAGGIHAFAVCDEWEPDDSIAKLD